MSAGEFTLATYDASYGNEKHPIRVQPETLEAKIGSVLNKSGTGNTTNPISARVGGARRGIGLYARTVRIQSPAVNEPSGYKKSSTTVIPALTVAFYNAATKNSEVTYLGKKYKVLGRSSERAS